MAGLVKPVTHRVRAFRRQQAAMQELANARRAASDGQGYSPTEMEQRFAASFEYFAETCLHLAHIDGTGLVPVTLTDGQRLVAQEIDRRLAANEIVRLVVLKSRRSLISSLCEAAAYWRTSTRPYTQGAIIAHKQDVTEELFGIVDGFYLHDERRLLSMRPERETSNRRELWFGNPDKRERDLKPGLQSGLIVTSAEAKEAGRAGTYHVVHASEVAYWPEQVPVWQAIGIALSKSPGTLAVMESTANGQGGLFWDTYRKARRGPGVSDSKDHGKNEWLAIFLAWWQDGRNRVAKLDDVELARFDYLDPWEREYAETWKLSPEQVIWRRQMLADPICFKAGVDPKDVFRQEYPADDEEAFLASGKHFFLLTKVKELEENPDKGVKPPMWRGEVVNDGPPLEERSPSYRFTVKPKFVNDDKGSLLVWKAPREGTPYLIVVDPAEGLQQGDPAVIGVLDRARYDWVAFWMGTHLSSRQLAWTAGLVGWFYGGSLLVVEHNNHGIATIEELRRTMYPRLWHHQDVTRPGSEPQERVGWLTTGATRMYALNNLEAELRGQLMGIHFEEFFDQCRDFVWPDTKGKARPLNGQIPGPRARPGKHDDVVMTVAMGLAVHLNAGVPRVDLPEPKVPKPEETTMHPVVERMTMKEAFKARRIKRTKLWGY